MKKNRRFSTATLGVLTALSSLVALVVPLAGPAAANHSGFVLEVTPETQAADVDDGDPILTARLFCPGPSESCTRPTTLNPINIDFEIEGERNNADGNTPSSPDHSCNITGNGIDIPTTTDQDESLSCSVFPDGPEEGTTLVRAWIDHDRIQTTVEADLTEGRYAGPTDCIRQDDDPDEAPCETGTPQPGGAPGYEGACPGSPSGEERDCTDVVEINFEAESPTQIDCDDPTGPDTERETRRTGPAPGSTVIYTCRVTDFAGNVRAGVEVRGENENGVNDPDPNDDASFSSPDYGCTTNSTGTCTLEVPQVEGEVGTATICFFAGTTEPGGVRADRTPEAQCANETTGENQRTDGSDTGNDRADRVEVTWINPAEAQSLDCEPETDTNPVGTAHTITCTAKDANGTGTTNTQVDVEATGANDPDRTNSDSPLVPDFTCNTAANGSCSFNHVGAETGTTTYRAFIDVDRDNATTEADTGETQADNDNDKTDVVTKVWVPAPATLNLTPESDSAAVGECNPFTITVLDSNGRPAASATIDLEQVHERAASENTTADDEPTVGFCVPTSGPNPSAVDESQGDRRPAANVDDTNADEEDPDNRGTAGGETVERTNANGQVTIGITVAPGQGSDGTGQTVLTAFFDPNDNNDPDSSEPQDSSTKTWTAAPATGERSIDCEPETQNGQTGQTETVNCTVRDSAGQPDEGAEVTFSSQGVGTIGSTSGTTGSDGVATVTATSDTEGSQTVTGTLTSSSQNEPDTDECERAANDPQGSPAGACSDSVTINWQEQVTPECSDGTDNDGDGFVDFGEDPSCENAEDDSEAPQDEQVNRRGRTLEITRARHVRLPGKDRPALLIKGQVRSNDGFSDCEAQVPVKVQIRADGEWITRKSDTTNDNGVFKVLIRDVKGRYRAVATKFQITDANNPNRTDVCLKAKDTIRHRHN